MESITVDVNWVAVIVGAVLAYALGGFWYSEKCFAKKWKAGIGTPAVLNMPMAPGMLTQAVGTFLLAWVIGVTETTGSLALAILIALSIATLIKANGFFGGKTKPAIFIETSFVLVMVIVMILVHAVL
ncbi:MAG: twitching motility protein PilT [Candidatus Vogelbacteria bacterium CG10_big_fil_rev_8_21_14_0_10_45_14]|uniref:Twitching motility protein PilT n=1 Tax=Candidatus Vogelbacteria bacterium CG10_big_fil_rev_8_21_14_0_10_45_14 TaxID=1975042 RepID=A0A2H0RIQ4_9BACT|nr:MAG: twitching motility protein PilT [Candidatus Vogelbacteria bacterium CG10_big_fil_rev_8_21_14_0_10_45_14]